MSGKHGGPELDADAAKLRASGADPGVTMDELFDDEPTPDGQWWWVGLYLVDRDYGGPEEGGWWYDYGVHVLANEYPEGFAPRAFAIKDRAAARAYCDEIQAAADPMNEGRREIGSVLSTGRYEAKMLDGDTLPLRWPEQRPTYD
jgi:hypothetical protein